MKKILRYTITILLSILMVLDVACINAYKVNALEQDKPFKMECMLWYNKTLRDVEYVIHDDDLYIRAKDVPYLADAAQNDIVGGDTVFIRNNTDLYFDGARCYINNTEYYNLKEVMDSLNVSYAYGDNNGIQTITFQPYMTREELNTICRPYQKDIYNLYELGTNPGMYAGALWDIFSGAKINVLWGGYSRDLYEGIFTEIICTQPSEKSIFSKLSDTNKTIKKINDIYKGLNEIDLGKENTLANVLGLEANPIMELYNELAAKNSLMAVGDYLDLAERLWKIQNKTDLYVNAVRLGCANNIKNKFYDGILVDAATVAVGYYNENCDEKEILTSLLIDTEYKLLTNSLNDAAKLLYTAGMKKVTAILKLGRVFYDTIGGTEAYTATNATVGANRIQTRALEQYDYCYTLPINEYTQDSALRMKYSTILSLRACQYAYEKLKKAMDFGENVINQCEEGLEVLADIDDRYIYANINNEELGDYFISGKVKEQQTQSKAAYCIKKIEGSKNLVVDQELLGPHNINGTKDTPVYLAVQDENKGTTLATIAYYNGDSTYFEVPFEKETNHKYFFTLQTSTYYPQLFVYDAKVERLDCVERAKEFTVLNDNTVVTSYSMFSSPLYATENTYLSVSVCDDRYDTPYWDNREIIRGKSLLYYLSTDGDVYYGYVNEPLEATPDFSTIYWSDEYNDLSNIRYEVYKYNIKTDKSTKLSDCSIFDLLDLNEISYTGVLDGKEHRKFEAKMDNMNYYEKPSIMNYIKSFIGNKSIKQPTKRYVLEMNVK